VSISFLNSVHGFTAGTKKWKADSAAHNLWTTAASPQEPSTSAVRKTVRKHVVLVQRNDFRKLAAWEDNYDSAALTD